MSHFTVAVITKGEPTYADIKKALAPFQENNMGDCPREYLVFHSLSKEYKEEYETGTTERVKLKDGTLVYTWSDKLYKTVSKEEYEEAKANGKSADYHYTSGGTIYKVKYGLDEIGAELVLIPWKELHSTFEAYLEEWHDAKKDEETLDYGYWENPNAKWDWFTVGGRWAGNLTVASSDGYKKVDSARIKDLVFPDYQEKYNEAKRFWELKVEGKEPQNESDREALKWCFYKTEYFTNTYKDKETYAECEATFSTYAVIDKDGHWHAKGEMGWWGCSFEEEKQVVDFIKSYKEKVFDNAEEDDYITIVDCHI